MTIRGFITKIRKFLKGILEKLQSEKVDKVETEFLKKSIPLAVATISKGRFVITEQEIEPFAKEMVNGVNKINDWDQKRLQKLIDEAEKK